MENFVVCANKKIALEKFTSQVKIVTQNIIKKVLKVSTESFVNNCEINNTNATLSGKIRVNLLYVSIDDKIENAFGECDFIERQKFDIELTDLIVNDELTCEDVNFSSNEVICYVSHNIEINGIYKYNLPDFSSDKQSIVENKTQLKTQKYICLAEDSFSVVEECESNLKNIEVLNINSQVVIDDVSCSVDKIVVEGKVLCEYLYKDEDSLNSNFKQLDFRQEIQAENIIPNMKSVVYAQIKNNSIEFSSSEEKNVLSYNFEVLVKAHVYDDVIYDVSTDLFDLENEISITYDYIELKNYIEHIEQAESVLSQTDITEIDDFDDIVGVFDPKIKIDSIINQDDKAEINAKIYAYALYKNQESLEKLVLVKDFKFEIIKDFDKFVDDIDLNVQILSSKVKAGKELEVVYKVNCHAKNFQALSTQYVKAYEYVSNKNLDDAGIKVYITRNNQTIFDVAKALNVRPELISSQNEVEDVFESGKKIYVYSPINLL